MTKNCFSLLILLLLLGVACPGLAQDGNQTGKALLDLAVFDYESGDYQAAEKKLTQALSFDDGNAYINYYLGKVYLKTDKWSQATVYLDKARTVDRQIPGLTFDWAFLNYKLENFAAAVKLFIEIAADDPGNALARYYAGMSLYKQNQYKEALTYLDDAAQMSTAVRYNAAYYAGGCYLQINNIAKAEAIFTDIRDNAAQPTLRRAAEKQLGVIRQLQRQDRRYALIVKAGAEYDDNEVLEPVDNSTLYADEEDTIYSGYVAGTYDFVKTPRLVIGAGFGHYQTWHDDFDNLDLTGSLFDLYSRFTIGNYAYSLTYSPDYYWLEDDSYLCRHETRTTVSRESGNLLVELAYTHYQDDNMYDPDQDGYANEGFLRCLYALPKKRGDLRAGVGYQVTTADHDDYEYDMITTEVAAYLNLWWNVRLGFSGECEIKKYDNTHSTYAKKRDDTQYIGNVLLSRDIVKELLAVHLGYEYTENNSNIDDYEYESNAVKLFLTAEL